MLSRDRVQRHVADSNHRFVVAGLFVNSLCVCADLNAVMYFLNSSFEERFGTDEVALDLTHLIMNKKLGKTDSLLASSPFD